jgi:peptide/nickel transport system permease protein
MAGEQRLQRPVLFRYVRWLWSFIRGDFGNSIQFNVPVSGLLWDHLVNTGILAFFVFTITMSIALTLGVLSGIAEGTLRDRAISVGSVSAPRSRSSRRPPSWSPSSSSGSIAARHVAALDGFSARELVLPVAVLVIYNFGYYTRMTRASMAEVMTSQYVRTAVLKGCRASAW